MIDRRTYDDLVNLFTSNGLDFFEFMHTWDHLEAMDRARNIAASAPILLPTASIHPALASAECQGGSSVVIMSKWLKQRSRRGSKG
jgi:aminopeptidase-like protein